jgi:hypothetical protein
MIVKPETLGSNRVLLEFKSRDFDVSTESKLFESEAGSQSAPYFHPLEKNPGPSTLEGAPELYAYRRESRLSRGFDPVPSPPQHASRPEGDALRMVADLDSWRGSDALTVGECRFIGRRCRMMGVTRMYGYVDRQTGSGNGKKYAAGVISCKALQILVGLVSTAL